VLIRVFRIILSILKYIVDINLLSTIYIVISQSIVSYGIGIWGDTYEIYLTPQSSDYNVEKFIEVNYASLGKVFYCSITYTMNLIFFKLLIYYI